LLYEKASVVDAMSRGSFSSFDTELFRVLTAEQSYFTAGQV